MIIRDVFLMLAFTNMFHAQDVVNWEIKYNENTSQLIYTAEIDPGWHLYAQAVDPMAGPIPTSFETTSIGDVVLLEKVQEPKPTESYDPNFDASVLYFEERVDFTQRIKVQSEGEVTVTVTYMVCNDKMCLPPVDKVLSMQISK